MSAAPDRDRDATGRARNARERDDLGRPLVRRTANPIDDGPALSPAVALDTAQKLLDDGLPFTAHEVFEAVWKATSGPERELWRGLAQIAVGLTHALRGNETGARSLLLRGATTLTPFATQPPHRINLPGLIEWAKAASTDLSMVSEPPRLISPSGGVGA